jgi:hypothetical protein
MLGGMPEDAARKCPDCGADNPWDAEVCAECNHVLDPMGRVLAAVRVLRPSPPAPRMDLPGVGKVIEEEGKVIPRRRHTRVGFLGVGASDREAPEGSAPSWIWLAIGVFCLGVVLVAAVRIATAPPPFEVPGASPIQANIADSLYQALQRDSLDASNNLRLANLLYDTQNYEKAIPFYRRVLLVEPDRHDARVDLAVSLHQAGRTDEAFAELDRVLAAKPDHAVALFDVGVIREFIGELDEAEAAYRRVLQTATDPELLHVVEQRLRAVQEKKHVRGGPPPTGS